MDNETFTETFARYETLILRFVMAQTNDRTLADEICQQTFLAYFSNGKEIGKDSVKAWLLRTAQNLLTDYRRKASTRREIAYLQEEEQSSAENMEKSAADRQLIQLLLEDIRQQNEQWYEAIDYVFLREMNIKESAEQLGITPGMLRTRIYRARKYIQKKYGEDYF